jgi:hypothetical protein
VLKLNSTISPALDLGNSAVTTPLSVHALGARRGAGPQRLIIERLGALGWTKNPRADRRAEEVHNRRFRFTARGARQKEAVLGAVDLLADAHCRSWTD